MLEDLIDHPVLSHLVGGSPLRGVVVTSVLERVILLCSVPLALVLCPILVLSQRGKDAALFLPTTEVYREVFPPGFRVNQSLTLLLREILRSLLLDQEG